MSGRPTVNVITKQSVYGLKNSGDLIVDLLNGAGFRARYLTDNFYCGEGSWNRLKTRVRHKLHHGYGHYLPKQDINLFLERLPRHMFIRAKRQVLMPNQEWFPEESRADLSKIDLVLCKTRHAEEIFSNLGCRTAFTSFTSQDRLQPTSGPKRREFFMMGGNAIFAYTGTQICRLWARHPEWPLLTMSCRELPEGLDRPNLRLLRDYQPKEEIVRLQNETLFHLCITAAEGFGHKLNEGMSCESIVITTGGAPMNELITPERGILVKWNRTNPKHLGFEFHYDEDDLERAIEHCLRLTPEETASMATRGRSWFDSNDAYFRKEFPAVLWKFLESAPR